MSDSASLFIRTTLEPRGPAGAIVLTDQQVAALGGAKSVAVLVTVNGKTAPLRLSRMGGENLIGFAKQVRADLGVGIGEEIAAEIAVNSGPRDISLPPALEAALAADPPARRAFDALAPSHRKEFARWIGEAKRDDTRDKRVAEAIQMLHEGRTRG